MHIFGIAVSAAMELENWQLERLENSIQFLLDQRDHRCMLMDINSIQHEIIDLHVSADESNKSMVIKVSNTILSESAKNSDFIIILYINQYQRSNLLIELLAAIQPQNYCKIFFVDELIANPIVNKLVPRHELCTQDEIANLMQHHHILVDALPKILLKDIIARWYGWKVGDVIKITRSNEVYYRMVVERI